MRSLPAVRSLAKRAVVQLASAAGLHSLPTVRPRLWILMYHRVIPVAQAHAEHEEPGMYVTPETFARHLGWMRECFEIMRLGEWVARASGGEPLPTKACAITFDDGWRDNFEYALPLLVEHQVPATVFIVSGFAGATMPFWPNRLARLLAERASFLATDTASAWLRELALQLPGGLAATESNVDARARLIHLCKRHPDAWLLERIGVAEQSAALPPPERRGMLDWDEIRMMISSGMVDIGSHTCHHVRLTERVPPEALRTEIVDSRDQLQRETRRQVGLFCYPNGDYTRAVAALVADSYRAAVTTQSGINDPCVPLNQLKRLGMHEEISHDRAGFRARISGWM